MSDLPFPMSLPLTVHRHYPPSCTTDHQETTDLVHSHHFHHSFPSFVPGYEFRPSDAVLIVHYLSKKVLDQQLPMNLIPEVQLYNHHPDYLTDRYPPIGEKVWYFFTSRDRKHKNGIRPNRVAGNGYWKATAGDKPIKNNGHHIGNKKVLVFHNGKPSKNDGKTNWIMHEYRLVQGSTHQTSRGSNDMKLDDWVLCKVYKTAYKSRHHHVGEAGDNANTPEENLDGFDDDTRLANAPNNLDLSYKNERDAHMGLVDNFIGAEQVDHHVEEGTRDDDAHALIANADLLNGIDYNYLDLSVSKNEMDATYMGLDNLMDDTELDLSVSNNEMDTTYMGLGNPTMGDAELDLFLQYELPQLLSECSDGVPDNLSIDSNVNCNYKEITSSVEPENSFKPPMHLVDSNSQTGSSAGGFTNDDSLGLMQKYCDRYGNPI